MTALYALMLGVAAALFVVIRRAGLEIDAPAPEPGDPLFNPGHASHRGGALPHILLALPIVIITARALGRIFRRLGQPPVIGEVIAGIILGPSLLGALWPEGAGFLLPASVAPFLQVIAQIGVILFMFLVGLEINTRRLRHDMQATIAISHASIVVPFVLGSALALWLYPRFSSSDVPFTVFALFMGVSMSVTAFPVLARILTDRGIQRTPLGVLALTCAAVDDVTAWCLLGLVVAIARAQASGAVATAGMVLAFVIVMIGVVRPLMARLIVRAERTGHLTQDAIAMVVVALLLSALATEAIGIHALFGSFMLGVLIPHNSLLAREMVKRLNDVVVVLFLPAFFAYTGLRTHIGLLAGPGEWLVCGVIVAVACAGKFGGSAAAARLAGMPWRDAAAIGILMNTRGLMELVVLNVGLDLGVLTPKLFTMLVIMAVATTLMTAPVLHLLTHKQEDPPPADSTRN